MKTLTELNPTVVFNYIQNVVLAKTVAVKVDDLYAIIKSRYGDSFTKADRRLMKGRKYPKWRNCVDWARARGAKEQLFFTAIVGKGKAKKKYVFANSDEGWDWVGEHEAKVPQSKNCFAKTCPGCHAKGVIRYLKIEATQCLDCGHVFPRKLPRRPK